MIIRLTVITRLGHWRDLEFELGTLSAGELNNMNNVRYWAGEHEGCDGVQESSKGDK